MTSDPTPDELAELLGRVKTIAVLGIKADPAEDAHRVAAYLQARGYALRPVNPKLERVLDEPCVARLADLPTTPDLVDVFRAPAHLPGHVDEILALDPLPEAVWFQLGIRDDASAERLRAAGITVVQDRCVMVDHRQLLAGGA